MKKNLFAILIILILVTKGWSQRVDSAASQPKWTQSPAFATLAAPVVLASGSLILFDPNGGEHKIIKNIPGFSSHLDDYLQFAPIVMVYGLDLIGVEARNDVLNQSLILLKAELLMTGLVYSLKYATQVPRPNDADNLSYPSGHTAQAFLAATFLSKEFGGQSVWYSISGYAMATTVGVFRILKNRHRLTDVLMGAGLGILSTNLIYLTHKHRWGREEKKFAIMPVLDRGSYGLYLSLKL